MILEVAEITVKIGDEAAFERGVERATPHFLRAKGCHGVALHRVVENSSVYRLLVTWETVDNHMVGFRNSDGFQEWRRLVSPYFNGPPSVTHSQPVAKY
ncbi:antibiotic biosynthesis monooxygenase family protein [Rhizobium leguminosarum]|uniref:antibiotic biosynthesis monooxygenase family protein n=1 Tax=Rhizobium leguminosarum TaxID=384 RepID=UPI0015BE4ABD|nr:antibiotic biosynthesis monooxygenase family protein [Rhizobium leguminosarum]MBY5770116.1 antibiotic biosynthesis monooxygenase [Rhizobium leguminosarum]MBY5825875.1 antibiotic biosynthesis monooxygenase [Rhizobium leguminosarum]